MKIQSKTTLLIISLILSYNASAGLLLPPSLNPGDSYRLAFITDSILDPFSTDITRYDTFVQGKAAESSLTDGTTDWKVIGSTAVVDAIDHIGVSSSPIYNLNGELVAVNSAALWNTGNVDLLNPIKYTQFGSPSVGIGIVFTGTQADGTGSSSPLGGGPSIVSLGRYTSIANDWIDNGSGLSVSNSMPSVANSPCLLYLFRLRCGSLDLD